MVSIRGLVCGAAVGTLFVGVAVFTVGVTPASAKVPKLWQVVDGSVTANPDTQTSGSVVCPGTEVPVGGGSFYSAATTLVYLSTSEPTSNGWQFVLDNSGSSDIPVQLDVVCMKKPEGYVITSSPISVPPDAYTWDSFACPTKSPYVLGGGFSTSGSSLSVSVMKSYPLTYSTKPPHYGWDSYATNVSSGASALTTFAVCAKRAPKGYVIVQGPSSPLAAGAESGADANCPGSSVPLSGGVITPDSPSYRSASLWVETFDENAFWAEEDNTSGTSATLQAVVVCAGT